jgi:hypothetical protein
MLSRNVDKELPNFMICWPCISKYACNETNLMHYLSSVYWVTTPLHVSGLLVAHHQEVAMYICDNWYVLYVLRWVHTCNVTAYRNAVTLQVTDRLRSYDLNFHPVHHGVTVSCERYTMGFPVCYGSQKHHECKEGERSGRWWRVTLHVQTCSGRNRIIPLMRRPNTDSEPNMHVTLPRNQLLLCYVVTSPVHTVMIRCYVTR